MAKNGPEFWELKKKPWVPATVTDCEQHVPRQDRKPWCADCGMRGDMHKNHPSQIAARAVMAQQQAERDAHGA